MGGVVKAEQKFGTRVVVGKGGGHGARIDALENRMFAVETGMIAVAEKATHAAACAEAAKHNTDYIIGILDKTKGGLAFAKKHFPRAIAFATGICAAAGWGNPKLLQFIAHFFGA